MNGNGTLILVALGTWLGYRQGLKRAPKQRTEPNNTTRQSRK